MKKLNSPEEETVELLKLSEKEILVLILSELKKITENTNKKITLRPFADLFSYGFKPILVMHLGLQV